MIDLAGAARAYLGTPWREGGRSRETGLDCVGLIWRAALDCGIDLDPLNRFHRGVEPALLLRHMYGFADRVPIGMAAPGDILFGEAAQVVNVGIVSRTDPLTAIHTAYRLKVVEQRVDRTVYRIRGVLRLWDPQAAA